MTLDPSAYALRALSELLDHGTVEIERTSQGSLVLTSITLRPERGLPLNVRRASVKEAVDLARFDHLSMDLEEVIFELRDGAEKRSRRG